MASGSHCGWLMNGPGSARPVKRSVILTAIATCTYRTLPASRRHMDMHVPCRGAILKKEVLELVPERSQEGVLLRLPELSRAVG